MGDFAGGFAGDFAGGFGAGAAGEKNALVAGAAGLALLALGRRARAALVGVVEARALEDDSGGVEHALGLAAAAGAGHGGVRAHGVLHLEGDLAAGAVVVVARHGFLRNVLVFKRLILYPTLWHILP